jgi:lipopolysaccharide export system protein LptC
VSILNYQRRPALLLLGIGIVLAAGSFWLLEISNRSSGNTTVQSQRTDPDYFVDNFSYAKLDALGRLEYVIDGLKMTHYPVDKRSEIDKPVIRHFAPNQPPTTLRAERATVNGDRTEVRMIDKVVLERAQVRGEETLTVTSEYMLVLPEKDIVTSDRRVDIRTGSAHLSGTGMVANNATRQLTLESSVTGIYLPPNK